MGYGILHFARDHEINQNPVQSRVPGKAWQVRCFTKINKGSRLRSTSLSWLAKQSSTRHRTVTTAATLAEVTRVVVPPESALLVGRCRCLGE